MRGGYYHTGDVASRDTDGYLTYIGRTVWASRVRRDLVPPHRPARAATRSSGKRTSQA